MATMKRCRLLAFSVILFLPAGCTATTMSERPSSLTSPAPRECPMEIWRGDTFSADELDERFGSHLPGHMPAGFGFGGAYEGGHTPGLATPRVRWTDDGCRTISLSVFPSGPTEESASTVGEWALLYDREEACGNSVSGSTRCIGYSTEIDDGFLSVQTIGLTRAEADEVVLSIPI